MSRGADLARALYLELRALRLELRVEADTRGAGRMLDYGIAVDNFHSLSVAEVSSVTRRILDNENELVRLLANERDPDLRAIRKEGNCG
jgi:hypothetical protein